MSIIHICMYILYRLVENARQSILDDELRRISFVSEGGYAVSVAGMYTSIIYEYYLINSYFIRF